MLTRPTICHPQRGKVMKKYKIKKVSDDVSQCYGIERDWWNAFLGGKIFEAVYHETSGSIEIPKRAVFIPKGMYKEVISIKSRIKRLFGKE